MNQSHPLLLSQATLFHHFWQKQCCKDRLVVVGLGIDCWRMGFWGVFPLHCFILSGNLTAVTSTCWRGGTPSPGDVSNILLSFMVVITIFFHGACWLWQHSTSGNLAEVFETAQACLNLYHPFTNATQAFTLPWYFSMPFAYSYIVLYSVTLTLAIFIGFLRIVMHATSLWKRFFPKNKCIRNQNKRKKRIVYRPV